MKARAFYLPIVVAFLVVWLWAASEVHAHRLSGRPATTEGKLRLAKRQVAHDRRELASLTVRHWTLLSPVPVVAVLHRWWLVRDRAYVRYLERRVIPSWLVGAFLCIHRGEGSWTDPDPPYWGGLQMDYSFMSTYGGRLLATKGTADHWTPAEQIAVAVRAYRSGRGFYPWPTTARNCGLI